MSRLLSLYSIFLLWVWRHIITNQSTIDTLYHVPQHSALNIAWLSRRNFNQSQTYTRHLDFQLKKKTMEQLVDLPGKTYRSGSDNFSWCIFKTEIQNVRAMCRWFCIFIRNITYVSETYLPHKVKTQYLI